MADFTLASQQVTDAHVFDRVPPSAFMHNLARKNLPSVNNSMDGIILGDFSTIPQYAHIDIEPSDSLAELVVAVGEYPTGGANYTRITIDPGNFGRLIWTKLPLQRLSNSITTLPLPTGIDFTLVPNIEINPPNFVDSNHVPGTAVNTIDPTDQAEYLVNGMGIVPFAMTNEQVIEQTGDVYTLRLQLYLPAFKAVAGMKPLIALAWDGDNANPDPMYSISASNTSLVKANSHGSIKRLGGSFT